MRPYVKVSRIVFNAVYRMRCARAERRDEAVFLSRQTDSPSYDFSELAREFEERGWKVTMHLKKVRVRNLPAYVRHVLVEIGLLARCRVAVLDRYDPVVSLLDFECDAPCESDAVNCEFPSRPLVLQLWHAFGAFKKFGYQTNDTPEGHSFDFMRDYKIHRNYSWVVCSGEGCRAAFAEAFACPVERVVALRRPEYAELVALREDARNRAKAHGRRKVLMAPTLRINDESAHPFRELYEHRAEFEGGIDADVVWAFHPLEDGLPAPGNVSDALLDCDVVVTDYSSLVYEAYLLGKPAYFYVPDIDSYRVSPGVNFDPVELAPALCATTESELAGLIAAGCYPTEEFEAFVAHAFDAPETPIADFVLSKL
ncbi:MAG: CDP-glycerol glycerophosphotransferase family protein [Eggerthellaceae bacterium]|nr:CDP-glycerol glycerophosphotransferase family protein [Eggerthellaceae bacterium]